MFLVAANLEISCNESGYQCHVAMLGATMKTEGPLRHQPKILQVSGGMAWRWTYNCIAEGVSHMFGRQSEKDEMSSVNSEVSTFAQPRSLATQAHVHEREHSTNAFSNSENNMVHNQSLQDLRIQRSRILRAMKDAKLADNDERLRARYESYQRAIDSKEQEQQHQLQQQRNQRQFEIV